MMTAARFISCADICLNTKPVGASLLAKASCQSIQMLNVRTHSRAGSLPQDGGVAQFGATPSTIMISAFAHSSR
ncbi:hypothetical protein PspCFBP13508_15040 [Pseudomonas sp. CFBP13508]|nr:hypothetical protein PspCFBP13508_15040 [Pseudomonas sp. CFBP13508]